MSRGRFALACFRDRGFGPDSSVEDRDRIIKELASEATCKELGEFFRIEPHQAWMIAAKDWFDALTAAA